MSAVLAVASGTTVVYACPQLNNAWSPTTFTLTLSASAGPAGCVGTGSATATVTINDQPMVTVTPPSVPVVICESSAATFVDVTFTVATDNGDTLDVPAEITASGSGNRVCSLVGGITSGGECVTVRPAGRQCGRQAVWRLH